MKTRPDKIEYKKVNFEVKEIREDEKYFYFKAYLAIFDNIDRGDDVILKGAVKESLKEHIPSLFWSHKSHEPPLGVFDKLIEDDKGVLAEARMPLDDDFVKNRIVPQMKIGSLTKMSIGYSVWDGDGSFEMRDGIRYLKKIFLWEGSLVSIPMNPEATVLKTKSAMGFQDDLPIAPRDRIWNKVSALGRVEEWAGIDENGSLQDPDVQAKYKRAFLWQDHEDPDLKGSYKLPIADIIDGKLTVIPRAIFAAAAAMQGARGGVFIFREDVPKVTRTIEKYYEKMGLESPFDKEKSFRIDDFKSIDERTLEKLFKKGVRMSAKNSKMLVSFVKSGLVDDDKSIDQRDVANYDWNNVLTSIKQIKL
jgi:HK97 family phage prohead protease